MSDGSGPRPSRDAEWPAEGLEELGCCPLCGGKDRSLLYEGLRDHFFGCAPGHWSLHRCGTCGAGYLDPRPSRDSIHLAYTAYYTHGGADTAEERGRGGGARALRNGYLNARYGYRFQPCSTLGPLAAAAFPLWRRRSDLLVRHLPLSRGARLLDVGCGAGTFLAAMRDQGWQVTGLDFDPGAVETARGKGLDVELGGIEECGFPDESFDAITLSHVVEHLHDPVAALHRCLRLAKPGGRLWIETPNFQSLGHRLWGPSWRPLEPPRHLVLFGARALRRSCAEAGWSEVRVTAGLNAAGTSGCSRTIWAMRKGLVTQSQSLAKDRIIDALTNAAGFLSPSVGANLVVTAVRR